MNIKTVFEHRYIQALAKSAMAEGIELSSLSNRVRNLTAELSAFCKCYYIKINSNVFSIFQTASSGTAINNVKLTKQ